MLHYWTLLSQKFASLKTRHLFGLFVIRNTTFGCLSHQNRHTCIVWILHLWHVNVRFRFLTSFVPERTKTRTGWNISGLLYTLQLSVVDPVAHDRDLCEDDSKTEGNFVKAGVVFELEVVFSSIYNLCSHQTKGVNQPYVRFLPRIGYYRQL